MVAEEGLPALGRRAPSPGHILGDAGLADLDAELEQLAMDPRRSPQRIGNAHLADKPADLQRHRWSTATASRFPAPIQPKTGAVPADHKCPDSRDPPFYPQQMTFVRLQRQVRKGPTTDIEFITAALP